jgi:hypothetical protein
MLDLRRRRFLTLLGGAAAAWPLAARAQQLRRVGALINSTVDDPIYQSRVAAFRRSLRSLGWIEGKNLQLDIRWGELALETTQRRAVELAALTHAPRWPDMNLAAEYESEAPCSGADWASCATYGRARAAYRYRRCSAGIASRGSAPLPAAAAATGG